MNVHMVRAMGFTPAAAKSYAAEKKAEGDVAVEAGDFVAAIAAYKLALEIDPDEDSWLTVKRLLEEVEAKEKEEAKKLCAAKRRLAFAKAMMSPSADSRSAVKSLSPDLHQEIGEAVPQEEMWEADVARLMALHVGGEKECEAALIDAGGDFSAAEKNLVKEFEGWTGERRLHKAALELDLQSEQPCRGRWHDGEMYERLRAAEDAEWQIDEAERLEKIARCDFDVVKPKPPPTWMDRLRQCCLSEKAGLKKRKSHKKTRRKRKSKNIKKKRRNNKKKRTNKRRKKSKK